MAGTVGRVEKAGLVQKLYARLGLLLGQGARLHLADTVQLTCDADRLTFTPQSAKLTGMDTSQAAGTYIQADTVPAGKQWRLSGMSARRTAGAAASAWLAYFAKPVGGSANSSNVNIVSQSSGGIAGGAVAVQMNVTMNAGDALGIVVATAEAASTHECDYWYEEYDVA